jgi:hypothetical protein
MDTVTILRQLWRFRLLVLLVTLVAVAAGFVVGFKLSYPLESRKYTVGVASARILVDTPNSQVVEVSPEGSDAVGARATLLANLMVDGEIKAAIAAKAGLKPEKLIGVGQTAQAPGAAVEPPGKDSYVLTTEVLTVPNGGWLPIIEVSTQAPDAEQAKRLADAAIAGLTEFLDSKAAADAVPNAERLRVGALGVAQARETTRGPRLLMSLATVIFVFVAGCAGILAIAAVVRGLRAGEGPQPVAPAERRSPEPAHERPGPGLDEAWKADLPEPGFVVPQPVQPLAEGDAAPDSRSSERVPESSPPTGGASWWSGGPGV